MTATDTEAALLAAIRENPGEETPRLVYADWLEENAGTVACAACDGTRLVQHRPPRGANYDAMGHIEDCPICHGTGRVSDGRAELAEFVRVQVELAKRNPRDCNQGTCRTGGRDRPCTACREREELQARERELWGYLPTRNGVRSYFESTLPGAAFCPESDGGKHLGSGFPIVLIQRGLPSVVRCTLAEWMGEPCSQCSGRGHRTLYGDGSGPWAKCQYCVDGRTPGIGPRLAQRWPIVEVEVVDITDFGFDSDGLWLAANLPSDLTGKIPNHGIFPTDDGRSFADWLSDALLAWARGQEVEEER